MCRYFLPFCLKVLYDLLEELNPLLAGCQSNKDSWQALGDNPDLVSHPRACAASVHAS